MLAFLAFLLVLASIISYLFAVALFGWYQPVPIVHLLLALGGLIWLFRLRKRSGRILIWVYQGFGWFLFLMFGWWTLLGSRYGPPPAELQANASYAASFERAEVYGEGGQAVALDQVLGLHRGTLLVFFRGFW